MWVGGTYASQSHSETHIFKGSPKEEVSSEDSDWHAPKNNVMKFHCPDNRCDVWTQVELWEATSVWTDSLES